MNFPPQHLLAGKPRIGPVVNGRRGPGPKCLYQINCRGLLGKNWGKNPIFTPESPQKPLQNPPGQKWGGVGVCDSVTAICHTTRTPRVHPKQFLFKATPLSLPHECRPSVFFHFFHSSQLGPQIQINKYNPTTCSARSPAVDQIKGSLIHPLAGSFSGYRVIPYFCRLDRCSRR